MDTREKILTAEEAIAVARRLGGELRIVSGWFDPLLAAHARRLMDLKQGHARLMVVLTNPPQPILPARARAELVAALAAVDYVVVAGGPSPEGLLARMGCAGAVRAEPDDGRIAREFIRHVHTRQRAG